VSAFVKTLAGSEIKTWLAGTGLAVKTRNNYFQYTRTMFNLARCWNLLDVDAFEFVEGFGNARKEMVRVFTVEQVSAFLNALRPEFVPLFALNAFSGFRREEITRMDWSHINLARRLIVLPAEHSKNGKTTGKRKMNEDIFENLVAWLKPYIQESGAVANFNKNEIQAEIERASTAAGFKWIKNAMRHSFASYAATAKGCEWTSKRCDHSEKVLRENYREVVTDADATRYFQIMPSA